MSQEGQVGPVYAMPLWPRRFHIRLRFMDSFKTTLQIPCSMTRGASSGESIKWEMHWSPNTDTGYDHVDYFLQVPLLLAVRCAFMSGTCRLA